MITNEQNYIWKEEIMDEKLKSRARHELLANLKKKSTLAKKTHYFLETAKIP